MGMSLSLIRATSNGRLQEVCDLLQEGANVNSTDQDGYTALVWASANGHTETVARLLKHDTVNVNHVNKYGDTALLWACTEWS
jgi:ankyrin repeat protein